MIRRPPRSTRTDTLFPYTTLFRSSAATGGSHKISIESLPLPKGLRIYALITPPQQSWPNGTITDEGIYLSVFRWLVSVIESLHKRSSHVKYRPEERRIGKECGSTGSCRWSRYHQKNKRRTIK